MGRFVRGLYGIPLVAATESDRLSRFRLHLGDAFTPDPGTEGMYIAPDNKFAFSSVHLSKLINSKSLHAFYGLGGS